MYKWEIFASAEAKTVEGSSGTALWDNVANLRILPGMGKIVLSAGSPGWGTRGKHKLVTLHLYLDCIAGNGDYIAAGVDGYAALRAVGCP